MTKFVGAKMNPRNILPLTHPATLVGVGAMGMIGAGAYYGGDNGMTVAGVLMALATAGMSTYNVNCLGKGGCAVWSWILALSFTLSVVATINFMAELRTKRDMIRRLQIEQADQRRGADIPVPPQNGSNGVHMYNTSNSGSV